MMTEEDGSEYIPSGMSSHTLCLPPQQQACTTGEAQFLGETECGPIGSACESGDFTDASTLRALAPGFEGTIHYVQPGAAGNGSLAQPFGDIATALGAAAPGDIIALSTGTHTERILLAKRVAIVGACVAQTIIEPPGSHDTEATVFLGTAAGSGAHLSNLTITGQRPGLWVGDTSMSADAIEIRDAVNMGVFLYRAEVTLDRLVIRDTAGFNLTGGWGLLATTASTLHLDQAVLERNHTAGIIAYDPQTWVEATNIVVRDTESQQIDLDFGRGIDLFGAAEMTLGGALIERNRNDGVASYDPDTTLTLTDAVIRDTRSFERLRTAGGGILVALNGHAHIERVLLAGNRGRGGGVATGGSLELVDVVSRNALPEELSQKVGVGLHFDNGELAIIERVVIEHNRAAGLFNRGMILEANDLVVRETASQESNEEFGAGIDVDDFVVLDRVLVEQSSYSGIVLTRDDFSLRNIRVRDTRSEVKTAQYGRGLGVGEGATVFATFISIEDSREIGIAAFHTGTSLFLEELSVLNTAPRECAEIPEGQPKSCVASGTVYGAGHGVGIYMGAAVDLRFFDIANSALAGVQIDSDATLVAADGVVRNNLIGVNNQNPNFDLSNIAPSVEFIDNDVNFDGQTLPVPDPLSGLED